MADDTIDLDPGAGVHHVRPAPLLLITGFLVFMGLVVLMWGAYTAAGGEGSTMGMVFGLGSVCFGVLFASASVAAFARARQRRNLVASVLMLVSGVGGAVASFCW